MKKVILFFLLLISFTVYAQQDTISYIVVTDIVLKGNNVTKPSIIFRELNFSVGDTIAEIQWEHDLKTSNENLINTSLFNFVDFEQIADDSVENGIILVIKVLERWYIWPVPYLAYSDRNLNSWFSAKDIKRISYGVNLYYRNFLGLKHDLILTAIGGYDQDYSLTYDIPYLTYKQNLGLEVGIGYTRNKEVPYKTESNKIIYFNGGDKFACQSFYAYLKPYYRFGFRDRLYVMFGYQNKLYHDSIPVLNPDFDNMENTRFQYFTLTGIYKDDYRDDQNYPLHGHYFELLLEKIGLGAFKTSPDVLYGKITFDCYLPIKGHWYWASNITTKLSEKADPLYFLNKGLGYNNDYVRSYELYVIDAMNFALIKNNLKFAILNPVTKYISFIKNERFGKIHIALYANIFFDCAYSWKIPNESTSILDNKFIYGTGIGIDFVTYYDKVIRLEYSINDRGETGLFIHLVAPI